MSKRGQHFVCRGLVFFALVGLLSTATAGAEQTIRIGGTGAALGTMKLIAAAFEKENPGIKVMLLPSLGSSGGIRAVSQGALDIGISSRPLQSPELSLGLSVLPYAKTPFVLVTGIHEDLSNVSSGNLVAIFRGEMRTWPDGENLRLILRPASDADTEGMKRISPEMSKAVDVALSREGMLIALTDQENADMLETIPGALGFCSLTQIRAEKRRVKVLSLDGVTPSLKTLANGSYPLVRQLALITKAGPLSPVQRFLGFIRSTECGKILRDTGNVPVLSEFRP
jgi:phosphate transport system substrate-binding protein